MANGIGSVWAANFGEDGKPNGVGSVWIANASALVPSGGATEEQINELSAAIDYVSANAGDPNALTGYQDGGKISATDSLFEASGTDYDFKVNYSVNGNKGLLYKDNDGSISAINFGIEFKHTGANYSGAFKYDVLSANYNNDFDYCVSPYVFSAKSNNGNNKIIVQPNLLTLTDHPGGSAFLNYNGASGQPMDNVRWCLAYNGVSGEAFGGTSLWQIEQNKGLQLGATTSYPNLNINKDTGYVQKTNNGNNVCKLETTALKLSAGDGNTSYGAVEISTNDVKLSSYNNTATYSLTSMAQILPKSGDFLNTKKYISFGSQGAVLADKFERLSAVSSYETSFTKVGTLNSATEGVSAVNGWYTTVTFPITALSDKETFKANWSYNSSSGTFYVLNEPYNGGARPSTSSQVYSGDFKPDPGVTDSFYVTGLTPNADYYVYLYNIGYNQSAKIGVDYGTSTFASATMYMNGIVVPDNDKVNTMASDLTAMSAAIGDVESLLSSL